jgi:hypothetical protein
VLLLGSSVSVVTRLRFGWSGFVFRQGRELLPSPQRPDRLWGSPRKWVVHFMPRCLYIRGKNSVSYWLEGGVGPWVVLDAVDRKLLVRRVEHELRGRPKPYPSHSTSWASQYHEAFGSVRCSSGCWKYCYLAVIHTFTAGSFRMNCPLICIF